MTIQRPGTLQSLTVPATIQDFQRISRNTGWVILSNKLYWTSDNGNTWQDISPAPSQELRTASFLDDSLGFAVTSRMNADLTISYQIFITNNRGASWQEKEIATYALSDPDALASNIRISFENSLQGWVQFKRLTSANFSLASLFRTQDGGTSWQTYQIPEAGEMLFFDASSGYLAGGTQFQNFYRTSSGGVSWDRIDLIQSEGSRVTIPNFISSALGHMVMFEQRGQGTVLNFLESTNSGISWNTKTEIPISENEWLISPISLVPGEIKILTPKQVITFWQTADLLEVEDRQTLENISDFEMVDDQHGWALAHLLLCENPGEPGSCTPTTRLLQTQDGGVSWIKINLPLEQISIDQAPRAQAISPESVELLSRTSLHSGQGFDQCEISTLSNLQKWKTNSPYSVVNLYIGGKARGCANSNLSPEFIQALSIQGWKFIPTWVGPQAACTNFSVTMSWDVSRAYLQGRDQAIDAARVARKYGLSFSDTDESGTVIYYDLEAFNINDAACLNAAKAFINGWVEELHTRGVMAGVYGSVCSSGLKEFYTLENPPDVLWPALWVSNTYISSITTDDLPCVTNSMWGNHQRIFQYTGAHNETWGGTQMYIDLDAIDGIVSDISSVVGVPASTLGNPSFEQGSLPPWQINPSSSACTWEINNLPGLARTGNYSLSLGKTAAQTGCLGAAQPLTLTPVVGDTYRFAIWAKSSESGSLRSLRLGITGNGTSPETSTQKFSGIGDEWVCLEVAHTINQGNLTGIQVQVNPEDPDGIQILLDDAHVSLNTGPICAQVLPPTGVFATDGAAADMIKVLWDSVPGASYYKIYRSVDLSSEKIQVGFVLSPQFIDQDGQYYESNYYWVKACNANNCSVFSMPDIGEFASPFITFSDSFETGSTSRWIDVQNPAKIATCSSKPINGQVSLCISANTQTSAALIHNAIAATNVADISFKINTNSANLGTREYILLEGIDTSLNKIAFSVKLAYFDAGYHIQVQSQDNSGVSYSTQWFKIANAPTTIEVRWKSTLGHLRVAGKYNGLSLLIDGIEQASLFGIPNNQIRVDKFIFGAQVNQTTANASGQFYLDDFSLSGPYFIRPNRP